MSHKFHSKQQLRNLLETTSEQVFSILLSPSQHNNQAFYQNFTAISLRTIRYINAYLNHLNTDQRIGKIIDQMTKGFSDALKEYKSRNIFFHSSHVPSQVPSSDHADEEDEIYHFMNTRNNLLPVECLSNYQNDKQRKQLQDFVQQMKKHTAPHKKQNKRSLMLPKDNSFQIKIGRKRTYDPTSQIEHKQENTQNNVIPLPILSENAQTQTECIIIQESSNILQNSQLQIKKSQIEMEVPSSIIQSVSDADIISLSHNQLKAFNTTKHKEKKKGLYDSDSKNKKKAKFASNQNIIKSLEPIRQKQKSVKKSKKFLQSNQCSLKLLNINDKILSICRKEVDYTICNSQNITIAINYTLSEDFNNQSYRESKTIILGEYDIEAAAQALLQTVKSQPTQQINIQNNQKQFKKPQSRDSQKEQKQNGQHKKKYLIMKSNTKPLHKQSQKIPISYIKIVEDKENQSQTVILNQTSKTQNMMNDSKLKGSIKRKKYNGDRRLFQSFIMSEGQSEAINLSQNLRTSKINIQLLESLKKPLTGSNPKFPSFAAKNQAQSQSSSPSHDYLKSIQKSDPLQLVNRLIQLQNQSLQKQTDQIDSKYKETPTFTQKISHQQSFSQISDKGSFKMLKISNAHRLTQEMERKVKCDRSKFFQANRPMNGVSKCEVAEKESVERRSFLKKNHHLSVLYQSKKQQTHNNSSILAKQPFLNLDRSQSKTIKISSECAQTPLKSIFSRQSTQMLPVRVPFRKLIGETRSQSSSNSTPQHKVDQSSSSHLSSVELQSLKRKLRHRAYKDKLSQYLQLIQTTHLQFCGRDCEHLRELYTGKEGNVAAQIIRLFKRLK